MGAMTRPAAGLTTAPVAVPAPGSMAASAADPAKGSTTASAAELVSLLGLDPATYRRHALHQPRAHLRGNQLLHRHPDRAAPRPRRRAAGGAGLHRADGLRGRPVDVLQAVPRGPRAAVRDRRARDAALPAAGRAGAEQIARGRTLIVELDSWYLPDTLATTYRREHVKSSVVVEGIDPAGERLRYFHGTGLYELAGEDYRGVLPPR